MVSPISGTHDMAKIKLLQEEVNDRIALAQARIEAAVAAIQSGSQWQAYLKLQSSLHRYSANNVWLICGQHAAAFELGLVDTPWPTYTAGFNTWKALGRSVAKGQHGYQILAPNRRAARVATDAAGHARSLGAGEAPSAGEELETKRVLKGFRIEHVFAAEQTTGHPLPEPPRPRVLDGQAPDGLWDNIIGQITDRGYAVRMVPSADAIGEANGRTTWDSHLVEVRSDMDEAARVKTAIHELGHVLLHDPAGLAGRVHPSLGLKEVEAASVAFIVADAPGVPPVADLFLHVTDVARGAGTQGGRQTACGAGRPGSASHGGRAQTRNGDRGAGWGCRPWPLPKSVNRLWRRSISGLTPPLV
mgnify:CR=1 FL=1